MKKHEREIEAPPPDVRISLTKGAGLVISLWTGTSTAVEKLVRKFLGDAREEKAVDEKRRLVCLISLIKNLLQIGARIEVHRRPSIAGSGATDCAFFWRRHLPALGRERSAGLDALDALETLESLEALDLLESRGPKAAAVKIP